MKLRLLVFVGLLTSLLLVRKHRQVLMMLPSWMRRVRLFRMVQRWS